MVTAREAAAAVVDPELRVVTIEELGILREVSVDPGSGHVTVTITPTYTGCPAMDVIRADIRTALAEAGHPDAEVRTVFGPPWTTDWITESGRAKLAAAHIAPPPRGEPSTRLGGYTGALLRIQPPEGSPLGARQPAEGSPLGARSGAVPCPRCGSLDTEQLSRFGSTACKALWRCRACTEPFEHMKAL